MKKTKPISLHLDVTILEKIDTLAAEQRRSRTAQINMMLDVEVTNHLDEIKKNLIKKMTEKLKNVTTEQEKFDIEKSIILLSKKVLT
jgi:hypothetical protein